MKMQKTSLFRIALAASMLVVAMYGCRRTNTIDENQIIKTPYSLYFSDTSGALFNSNDGINAKSIFPPDGKPGRSLVTTGNNILWAKNNLYISTNHGKNFNHSYDSLASYRMPTCGADSMDMNQSMMLHVSDWPDNDFVFVASSSPEPNNFLGVAFSQNYRGAAGYWWVDPYDTLATFGSLPVTVTSLTELKDKTLCGYDNNSNRSFYRLMGVTTRWKEAIGGVNPTEPGYTLGHLNNRLILVSTTCNGKAYYSDDKGVNWTEYSGGLPMTPSLCISSPFDQVVLVGTQGAGLYMLNTLTGKFVAQNNGLPANLVVRGIAAKQNVLKSGSILRYIYIATNQGIYQSKDGGFNWIRTIPGNYVLIY
jgi:hypothetical protein